MSEGHRGPSKNTESIKHIAGAVISISTLPFIILPIGFIKRVLL